MLITIIISSTIETIIHNTTQNDAILPLLSTRCSEFVTCNNYAVVQQQACAANTMFDGSIKGWNWLDLVDCSPWADVLLCYYKIM